MQVFTYVFALCAFVLTMLPSVASAHATPIEEIPSIGSTELSVPASISIRFTERIEVGASSLTVFDPNGAKVNEGKGSIDTSDPRMLVVPIRDGGEGVYTVSWQVVSVDDGHFTKGAYSFLVDSTGKAFEGDAGGGAAILYTISLSDALFSFFGLLGESLLLGGLLLLWIVKAVRRRRAIADTLYTEVLSTVCTRVFVVGFLTLLVGTGATVIKKTIELQGLQTETFLNALTIYLGSTAGMYGVFKLVLGLVFVAVYLGCRKKLWSQDRISRVEGVLLISVSAILVLQSIVSHAAASLFYPTLSIGVTFVHLFAKELMIGGVLVLCFVVHALYGANFSAHIRSVALRFDRIAAWALLCAGLTGVYVTWLHLKRFANLSLTEWGDRFKILLLLTVFYGCFRVLHHFVIHPLLSRRASMLSWYRFTLPIEVVLALMTLFYSGYLSLTTPPFVVEQYQYAVRAESEGVTIDFETHPYEERMFRLVFTDSETGAPKDLRKLTVTAVNEEQGIGPNVLPVQQRFPGGYVVSRDDLSPHGVWQIGIMGEQMGRYNTHTEFTLRYPDAVVATRWSDEVRTFDDFARMMLFIGALISAVSLVLMVHAHLIVRQDDKESLALSPVHRSPLPITAFSLVCAMVIVGVTVMVYYGFLQSDFQKRCVQDGFVWKQSFPARDMEATSPNALSGCFIHDGHYHIIDEREYESAKADVR